MNPKPFVNTLGMRMLPIPAGTFSMGDAQGDDTAQPVCRVTLTQPFYLAETPVTNAQYEAFDPAHRAARALVPHSPGDDDAALFISYEDALRFADWLGKREGRLYLLPTEAQWEYAARAGSEAAYSTGDVLPEAFLKNPRESWYPDPDHADERDAGFALTVGRTPANAFGLRDVHGLVDEWCADWYAPYEAGATVDPLGPLDGEFRVLRGGSHSTEAKYLRSGSRSGSLPGDRSHVIGMRLCLMDAPREGTFALPRAAKPQWAAAVSQRRVTMAPPAAQAPRFDAPRPFVRLPEALRTPRYAHNHGPALAICPNGDLLAAWFSCPRESGREMAILAARLRRGAEVWDEASVFWAPPNRNASCTALLARDGVLYHFNGLSACATWANVATAVRRSLDNGATWSPMRIVQPDHRIVCMPSGNSPLWLSDGRAAIPCDTISVDVSVTDRRGSCLLAGDPDGAMEVLPDGIAGIHAAVAELRDGSLLAYGRANLEGFMPASRSTDGGRSWRVERTAFPFVHMGQRPVLKRLPSGALFLASFSREGFAVDGRRLDAVGLFGALSYDEGRTWPVLRPIVPDRAEGTFEGGAWTGTFRMDALHAEPRGYLTADVAADGTIHLLSSGLHYAFNEAWLTHFGKD